RLAADEVLDDRLALVRRTEAQRTLLSRLETPVTAEAVVATDLCARRRAQRHVLARAVAVVRLAGAVELGGGGPVRFGVVGLEVRTLVRPGLDAEPCECVDDALGPLRAVARGVGVLDPQDERAAVLLREDPVLQGGAGSTNMEHSGRRWGEAYANSHPPSLESVPSHL